MGTHVRTLPSQHHAHKFYIFFSFPPPHPSLSLSVSVSILYLCHFSFIRPHLLNKCHIFLGFFFISFIAILSSFSTGLLFVLSCSCPWGILEQVIFYAFNHFFFSFCLKVPCRFGIVTELQNRILLLDVGPNSKQAVAWRSLSSSAFLQAVTNELRGGCFSLTRWSAKRIDVMDLKSSRKAPVLTDPTPMNKPRLGLYDALLPYSSGAVFSAGLFLTVPWKKHGVHSDVHSTSWLDEMKSSSPTHRKRAKDSGIDVSSNDLAVAYCSWMLRYPSAITSFEHIINNAKGKRIALFLDYDGTLSPIVDDPDHAFMSDEMRTAVKNVAKDIPTAIISGRSRWKVHEFVGLQELYYAGSHGMDIMAPNDHTDAYGQYSGKEGEEVNLFQPASEFLPMINEVYTSLVGKTEGIKGAKIENNKFCVSVHYRNVDEKSWPMVAQYVQDILKHYPRLQLTHGRKVLEVRPVIKWDKGKAVEFLLESLGLGNSDDVLSIYVGDDRTDEDAFKLLREGGRGFGILVSSAPKESSALYSLKDPSEVMEFLKLLGDEP